MSRKPIPKKIREKVYKKYDGHCAYCGCMLEYKDMQVDHIDSIERARIEGRISEENIDNYNPACRQCNFYKGTYTVDEFRKNISKKLLPNLQKNFNYKLALKYGLIREDIKPVLFYFEIRYKKKDA